MVTQFSKIWMIDVNILIVQRLTNENMKNWKKILSYGTARLACLKFHFLKWTIRILKNLLYPTNTLQQPPDIIKNFNKEIKNLMERFKQVNDFLDPSENLTSCDYYDIMTLLS